MPKHRRLDTVLRSVRQDVAQLLSPEAIETACRQAGHSWRNRILTPFELIHLFLVQILLRNTSAQHISLLAGRSFTDSAFCQARARMPLSVYRNLLSGMILRTIGDTGDEGLWHGHRTWLIDGSSVSMPDTPELQSHFGQPGCQKSGCGFPVAKLLTMFHAGTALLTEIVVAPLRSHELSKVASVRRSLKPGDVIVGDRGFCSYLHLAMLRRRGVHGVFRVHQRLKVDFAPGRNYAKPGQAGAHVKGLPRTRQIRKLGPLDQIVEWYRPASVTETQEDDDGRKVRIARRMKLRELQYETGGRGFRTRRVTLVTTLLDGEKYSAESLARLYGTRWRVEQKLRDLKQTLGMDVLKCMTVEGVLKEIHAFAIVHNLVRLVAMKASKIQGVAPDRISFVDALRWLELATEESELPHLTINPVRYGRFEPRVLKRRLKEFTLMKRPRRELKQDIMNASLAA